MQGWKTENCSSLPETLEMVNANTYIQRRNINRIERDSMDGSEEKEVGYTCEYRFLSEEEYYRALKDRQTEISGVAYDIVDQSEFQSKISNYIQVLENKINAQLFDKNFNENYET